MRPATTRALVFAALVLASAAAVGALIVAGRVPSPSEAWERLAPSDGAPGGPSEGGPGDSGANGRADSGPKRGRPQAAPLSSAQLGQPLVSGAFVTACGAPGTMKVVVKVAVKQGRAVDVNVQTDPPDTAVCDCVQRAIGDMRWDASTRTDHVTVRY